MGLFDFLKRGAKDLGEAADDVKDKFDQELTKREQELEMTPSEKIAALQEQAAMNDARFDQIADKASGRNSLADAVAEVGEIPRDASLPNVTHIVLPDGRVRSGNDAEPGVDGPGIDPGAPAVDAPPSHHAQSLDPVAQPPMAPSAEGLPSQPTLPGTPAVPAPGDVADYLPSPPADVVGSDAVGLPEMPAVGDVADYLPSPPADVVGSDAVGLPEMPAVGDVADYLPSPPADVVGSDPVGLPEMPAPPSFDEMVDAVPSPPADVVGSDPVGLSEMPAPPSFDEMVDAVPSPSSAPVPGVETAAPVTSETAAEAPAPETDAPEAATNVPDTADPDYGKTPAQLKYERARSAANDLLDELRGELKDEGEI